ncbi:RagB/SusD family nutrient uptake outer membrane protein [uncultured Pedobacter sp.]|uniref:RagB/SusD family nutrient uptake outer membrane protein n=1 Tax=uncultured Pedobacter sp. TaxID=246139 RepID=UPI0026292379|nr:RagB/SusD family nutrient uptake outer membrane protein [uncultured Pedobacter sp.]
MTNLKTYIYKISVLLTMILFTMGCRKFVEIGSPKNQLVTKTVFENDGQAIAAMANIYGKFTITNAMGYHIPYYLGSAADELTNYTNDGAASQFYQNAPQPLNASTNGLWDVFYNCIYQANAVVEGCSESTKLDATVKKQLLAEARFFRAFCYFYLVNFYGDVPLPLQTDYRVTSQLKRSTVDEVYAQIIADLEYAATELNSGYVNATAKATGAERVRPNQAAAHALLARVYLYRRNWIKAEEQSTIVINDVANYDMVAINQPFLKNNREAIWQLMASSTGANLATIEGTFFILTTKPSTALSNSSAISPQLYAAFNPADLRRSSWIGTYIDKTVTPNVTYYFPNKFKERTGTSFIEYSTPLRLAEQYLIRAEARNELNNLTDAKADLNKVRARTNLGNTTAATQTDLRTAIFNERQLELFTEWGHRWFDLRRSGNIGAVMTTVTPAKGGATWANYKQWFPIPQKDIEANRNIIQNNGYE